VIKILDNDSIYDSIIMRVVLDTNVFISSLIRGDGVNRRVLEMAFEGQITPVMGDALYFEYESVMMRDDLFENSLLNATERSEFLDALCSVSEWVEVYYKWRPNLRDEADNHVLELALSGNAPIIISSNLKDFRGGDLDMPDVRVINPVEFIRQQKGHSKWQH